MSGFMNPFIILKGTQTHGIAGNGTQFGIKPFEALCALLSTMHMAAIKYHSQKNVEGKG